MPPRISTERDQNGRWVITATDQTAFTTGATVTASSGNSMDFWDEPDPFVMPERPHDAIDTSSLDELERLFMESQRRSHRLPPLPDSAPQVNIKRHLSKNERDSKHNPAPDKKKLTAISLDDLVSI